LMSWFVTQVIFGVDAKRDFRGAPEKFSTHISIAFPLCNSGLNGI
jgi:hypothetical protein